MARLRRFDRLGTSRARLGRLRRRTGLVGTRLVSAGSVGVATVAILLTGPTASASTPQVVPGAANLVGVTCPTTSGCVAVGGSGASGVVVPINNGFASDAELVSGTAVLDDVACPSSSTSCVGVGRSSAGGGAVVPIAGGFPAPNQVVAGVGELQAVACPSDSECLAVGHDTSAAEGVVVPITGGVPGQVQAEPDVGGLTKLACASASTCVAVGHAPAGGAVVVAITDGVPGPAQSIAGDNLFSVACSAASTHCVAVGTNATSAGVVVPITAGVAGPAQTISSVDSGFNAAACGSATSCVAVGTTTGGHAVVPITDGVVGPTQIVPGVGPLLDVACSTAARCVATGNNFTQMARPAATILPITDGVGEQVETLSTIASLQKVACVPGAGGCVAVGEQDFGGPGAVVPIELGSDQITVSALTLDPSRPSVSDASVTATLTVRNDYPRPVTAVTPSLVSSDPATLKVTTGPDPSTADSLGAGASASFVYTLTPLQAATVSLQPAATAVDPVGTSVAAPAVPPRVVDLSTGDVSVALAADPPRPAVGDTSTVTATITNKTALSLTDLTPSLSSSPTDGVTLGASSPGSVATLGPHASATVTWLVTGQKAETYQLRAVVSLTDPQTGPEVDAGTLPLTFAMPGIVVTTTGDESLPDSSKTLGICDVDPKTDGNQCTLRAAIQLANDSAGADQQPITFDIAGDGMPKIAPPSSLPQITANVAVDGTTQHGGLVQLDGANAGTADGLILTAPNASVRGLAVTHWGGAGLRLEAAGQTVTGSRIGTADGETPAANVIGVRVEGSDAVVGGSTGTDVAGCTGDCNLISGNDSAGVQICNGGNNTRVLGDWIGLDADGMTPLGDGTGVDVASPDCPSGGSAPTGVTIGGPTPRPGAAPGNVISGNSVGLWFNSAEKGRVLGNLVGTDPSGTRAVRNPAVSNDVGIRGSNVDIGGPDPSDRNVISGLAAEPGEPQTAETTNNRLTTKGMGVLLYSGTLEGNYIGTDITGTKPLDDSTGITALSGTLGGSPQMVHVLNNVISGNYVGVFGFAQTGDTLTLQGNRIGTVADGESALPNHFGVFNRLHDSPGAVIVGSARAAGDGSCDSGCNLISGNDVAGVLNVDQIVGNFIGTDLTGSSAIPNGRQATASAFKYAVGGTTIGGASSASTGTCDRACNLIAGNSSVFGVQGNGGQVQGNVIGVSATGQPLPNAAGVLASPSSGIGGDDPGQGNLIADNAGPAVFITTGQSEALPDTSWNVPVLGNLVYGNGAGIEYGPLADPSVNALLVPPIPPGTGGVLAPPIMVSTTYQATTSNGIRVSVQGPTPEAFNDDVTATTYRIDLYSNEHCDSVPQGAVPVAHASFLGLTSGFSFDSVLVPGAALTATVTINNQTSTFSRCIAVDGSASLSRGSAQPGDTDSTSAGGFVPGESVSAVLHSSPVDLGTFTADNNGAVAVTFTIPADTDPGLHHVVLTGQHSGLVVSIPLTVWQATGQPPAATTSTTTTTLSASANPSTRGQQIRYTARVTPVPDQGTVSFVDDGATLPSCAAVPVSPTTGAASCPVTYSLSGSHVIRAGYSGSETLAASQSATLTEVVNGRHAPTGTSTKLRSSAHRSVTGQRVTYIATVIPTPDGGTMQFVGDGAILRGCARVKVRISTGRARCRIAFGRPGPRQIQAIYSGNRRFRSSRSSTLTQLVRSSNRLYGPRSRRDLASDLPGSARFA